MLEIKPKFLLKDPLQPEKPTLIYLVAYFAKKRFKYSTGKKIEPKYWDKEAKRVLPVKGKGTKDKNTQHTRINFDLNRISNAAEDVFNDFIKKGIIPSLGALRKEIDNTLITREDEPGDNITLNGYIDRYIKEMEAGTRLTEQGRQFAKGTIKNYHGFKVQFDAFQKKMRRRYNFDDITIDLYDDFVHFFNTKEKPYSANTIGRHIKNLKTIMRVSREEGLHNNRETERKKFKVIKVETEQIYLNESELERLYNLDLSETPNLELARDVFLIGCFTALRFSDYSRICKENLVISAKGNKTLHVITQKTGEKVIIPFWHWMLEELLIKYDYTVPKIYEQKLNKRIKEVGKKAELNDPIEIEKLVGGMKVKSNVPKNQLIMTHTARRSGATNMYNAKIPAIDIMMITGHKTQSSFMKYIRITKEETADRVINDHWVSKPLEIAK